MITHDEYNNAVSIIKGYHKQITETIDSVESSGKETILDWMNSNKMSTKLRNQLIHFKDIFGNIPIEHVDKTRWKQLRGGGETLWHEIAAIRK